MEHSVNFSYFIKLLEYQRFENFLITYQITKQNKMKKKMNPWN